MTNLKKVLAKFWSRKKIRKKGTLFVGRNPNGKSQIIMKTLINAFFIGLAILAAVHIGQAQPVLGVATTNNQVILFWPIPMNGMNGVLQSTTNLFSPYWLSATDALSVNYGSQIAVSVTNTASARFFRLSLVSPTSDGMLQIPAGSFTMGDQLDSETDAVPTTIYVSAFYIDKNLVELSQWQAVYSYAIKHGYSFVNSGGGKAANNPVVFVDWYDCVKWCNARSEMASMTPAYYTDGTQRTVYRTGEIDISNACVNWSANGYRLPTEAEWEKAARGGLSGQRFPWGNTISELQANYIGSTNQYSYDLGPNGYNSEFTNGPTPYTSPVGSFAMNGYGLYDMAGNVWEWCWDWYGTPYGQPTVTNPMGPDSGSLRVRRGGRWDDYALSCCTAFRGDGGTPTHTGYSFGLRCVRGF
jgi:formylglycine-generating enzyme required for sulfatase activity